LSEEAQILQGIGIALPRAVFPFQRDPKAPFSNIGDFLSAKVILCLSSGPLSDVIPAEINEVYLDPSRKSGAPQKVLSALSGKKLKLRTYIKFVV